MSVLRKVATTNNLKFSARLVERDRAEVAPQLLGRLDAGPGPAAGESLHPPGNIQDQDLWQNRRLQRPLFRQAFEVYCPQH